MSQDSTPKVTNELPLTTEKTDVHHNVLSQDNLSEKYDLPSQKNEEGSTAYKDLVDGFVNGKLGDGDIAAIQLHTTQDVFQSAIKEASITRFNMGKNLSHILKYLKEKDDLFDSEEMQLKLKEAIVSRFNKGQNFSDLVPYLKEKEELFGSEEMQLEFKESVIRWLKHGLTPPQYAPYLKKETLDSNEIQSLFRSVIVSGINRTDYAKIGDFFPVVNEETKAYIHSDEVQSMIKKAILFRLSGCSYDVSDLTRYATDETMNSSEVKSLFKRYLGIY